MLYSLKFLLPLSILMQSIAFVLLKVGTTTYFVLTATLFVVALIVMFARAFVWQRILSISTLSYVYPFTLITQILLFVYGVTLFGEDFNWQQVIGLLIVCLGLLISFDKGNK